MQIDNDKIKKNTCLYFSLLGIYFLFMYYLSQGKINIFSYEIFAAILLIVLGQYFFRSKQMYWLVVGVFNIFVLSVLFLRDFQDIDIARNNIANSICLVVCMSNLMVILPNFFSHRWHRTFIAAILWGSSFFGVGLFWFYYLSETTWLSYEALLAIMQTNFNETSSYIQIHACISHLLLLLALISVIVILCRVVYYSGGLLQHGKIHIFLLCLYIVSNLLILHQTYNKNYYTEPFVDAYRVLKEYKKFRATNDMRNVMVKQSDIIADKTNGLYVLVIGESQTRKHMSTYGYHKPTTPWLDKMSQYNGTLIFSNGYSCHTHTVPALSYALTEKNQYNNLEVSQAISLVDVARAAGFKVVWLSNQAQYGVYETPISVIADAADEKIFISDRVGSTRFYDGALIKELNSISISDRTLLIVHLMGCHEKYLDRYPSKIEAFSENNDIDCYDNAIYYNDLVMKELYENVQGYSNFKGLIYFSDHGEDVEDNLGHNSGNFRPVMSEIPLYMIFSKLYINENGEQYNQLMKARDYMFTNDLLYNTMLGIMGIHYVGHEEQCNDLSNSNYDTDEQRFYTLHGKVMIKDLK